MICVDAVPADLNLLKYSHTWHSPGQFLLLSIIQPPIERGSENAKRDAAIFLDGLNRLHAQMSELIEHLTAYLRGLLPSSTIESRIVEDLEVAETIIAVAKEWQADVIVMSPHEHRGIDKFLIGSVSQVVARHAHCSIELIR
jgi:nucleotide-binding universal stress UspA family protein